MAVLGSGLAPCPLTTLTTLLLCELSAVTHVLGTGGQRRGCRCLNALACKHFGLLRTRALESSLLRLGTRVVEVLHGDTPNAAWLLKTGDNAVVSRSLREKGARALGVADGGRKANAAGLHACHARQALNKAERLPASIAAHKRMDLVNDHIAQVAEHARDRHMLMDQECLERLGRNLQDAARFFDELCLVRLRDVAMPVPDGDVGFFAQVIETDKLIIDECLEGADVEGAHARGRVLPKLGQDGKEGRLSFARCRGCRQEHIVLCVEDGIGCCNLDRA